MPIDPEYGSTPLHPDEAAALTPLAGDLEDKAAVYDAEQAIQDEVEELLVESIVEGRLTLADLLDDQFLRDLHPDLYDPIWTWAGQYRTRELSIGIAPEEVAVQLRSSVDSIQWRWEHTDDLTPRRLGLLVHAETVRIHPFVDGNGRTTRLLGDLVYLATQDGDVVRRYDWAAIDKRAYIEALWEYDRSRDASVLEGAVGDVEVG